MGIKNGNQIMFKLSNAVAREVDLMLDVIQRKYTTTTNEDDETASPLRQRSIDCDVSNIIHKLSYRHSSIYSINLVRDVALFLKQLASDTGYEVTAVLDGDVRPQTKRDAFKRRYESTMNRINSFFCRQSAMRIGAIAKDERTEEQKEDFSEFSKEAKRLEVSPRLHIPMSFREDLERCLHDIDAFTPDRQSGGVVSRVIIKAKYEADYVMAYRFRNRLCHCIYSSDADMLALCGPNCISIRSFAKEKGSKRKRKEGDETSVFVYELSGCSNSLMDEIKECVRNEIGASSKIEYVPAKYPLLENVPPSLMSLIVVGIGCDVLPGGLAGITPLAVSRVMKKMEEDRVSPDNRNKSLMEFYLKKDESKKERDILTYCQAFLYQPAVEMGSENDPREWKYIFEVPKKVHPYLQMFVHPDSEDIEIEDESNDCSTEMEQCVGFSEINLPHSFLKAETSHTCSVCNKTFCGFCGYSPGKDRDEKKTKHSLVFYKEMNNDICVDCYKERIFLPHSCTLADVLSLEEMKEYLRERNQLLGGLNDIEAYEVQELYEMAKVAEGRPSNIDDVPFPTHDSDALCINTETEEFGFGKILYSMHLRNGGRFINAPEIKDESIAPILNLFANIVRFDTDKSTNSRDNPKHMLPYCDVLPSMIIDFAGKSRVGNTSFRLLQRCLRHSLDPKTPVLENNMAYLFSNKEDGEIGLVLSNRVPASMKDIEYNTTVAFTSNEIKSTRCNCIAGGSNKERIICVHNLPVIYQMVMLLDDGLAEHLLVELCSRWHPDLEAMINSEGKIDKVRKDIIVLMQSAGLSPTQIQASKEKPTVKGMLDHMFATGTQRGKKIPPPPSVKDLRPICEVDFSSVVSKAKKRKLKSGDGNQMGDEDGVTENEINVPPDYFEIYTSMRAFGFDPGTSDFTGHRVLAMRAEEIMKTKSPKAVSDYIEYKKKSVQDNINATHHRKRAFRNSQLRVRHTSPTTTTEPSPPTTTTEPSPPPPTTTTEPSPPPTTTTEPSSPASTTTETSPPSTTTTEPSPPITSTSTECQPAQPKKRGKKRGPRKYCCFIKCKHTERTNPNITRVTDLPKNKPSFESGRLRDVRRYVQKQMKRQHTLKACAKKDEGKVYFLCTHHNMETVTKKMKVQRGKNTAIMISHTFLVPSTVGVRAAAIPTRPSKGVGHDRVSTRLVNNMKEQIYTSLLADTTTKLLADTATTNAEIAMSSYQELDQLKERCQALEKQIYNMSGSNMSVNGCSGNDFKSNRKKIYDSPAVSYESMVANNHEVRRRTRFESLGDMMAYIVVLCNGDHYKITHKHSSLTWFEEWFFFFEFQWGRTLLRWVDAEATYKTNRKTMLDIFRGKLEIATQCRERWPQYVSYKEDHALMKEKWRRKFEGKRIVMWDDTNVDFMFQPSGADEQRLTYSVYYAGNCAKGGVFLQPCGWMGVEHLWVGATSDSHYQENTDIFKRQEKFARQDLVDNQMKPFTNMLDRGYRVNIAAWRAGKQEVMQPSFVISDNKFSSRQTIHTAEVAMIRSANERSVNLSKKSGFIHRGVHQRSSVTMMDNVWLTWSFQCNFIYRAVL